jgi:hypothetical protein
MSMGANTDAALDLSLGNLDRTTVFVRFGIG